MRNETVDGVDANRREELARAFTAERPRLAVPNGTGAAPDVEVVKLPPTRGAVPYPLWLSRFSGATERIDVLAYAGLFLLDTHPELADLIAAKSRQGLAVRLLLGDPESEAVRQPAMTATATAPPSRSARALRVLDLGAAGPALLAVDELGFEQADRRLHQCVVRRVPDLSVPWPRMPGSARRRSRRPGLTGSPAAHSRPWPSVGRRGAACSAPSPNSLPWSPDLRNTSTPGRAKGLPISSPPAVRDGICGNLIQIASA
jgi:hypothetical protein